MWEAWGTCEEAVEVVAWWLYICIIISQCFVCQCIDGAHVEVVGPCWMVTAWWRIFSEIVLRMEIKEPLSGQQPFGCKFCQHLIINCVICDETEFTWFFVLVSMFVVMFSLHCVVSMCCSMSLDHSAVGATLYELLFTSSNCLYVITGLLHVIGWFDTPLFYLSKKKILY